MFPTNHYCYILETHILIWKTHIYLYVLIYVFRIYVLYLTNQPSLASFFSHQPLCYNHSSSALTGNDPRIPWNLAQKRGLISGRYLHEKSDPWSSHFYHHFYRCYVNIYVDQSQLWVVNMALFSSHEWYIHYDSINMYQWYIH